VAPRPKRGLKVLIRIQFIGINYLGGGRVCGNSTRRDPQLVRGGLYVNERGGGLLSNMGDKFKGGKNGINLKKEFKESVLCSQTSPLTREN